MWKMVLLRNWSSNISQVSQSNGWFSFKENRDLLTFFIFFILNLQLLMPSLSEYGTNKETPPIQSSFLPILHWHVNYMTVTSHRFIQQIPRVLLSQDIGISLVCVTSWSNYVIKSKTMTNCDFRGRASR